MVEERWTRSLTESERQVVAAARERAFLLYEGVSTAHRSCGIALAETFSLLTGSYQALRRGGITGEGPCGAVLGGRMVLGETLGDPDPAGGVTPLLREAIDFFDLRLPERLLRAEVEAADGIVCNDLVARFAEFESLARASFCTRLATEVATVVAEALVRAGVLDGVASIEDAANFDPFMPMEPYPEA